MDLESLLDYIYCCGLALCAGSIVLCFFIILSLHSIYHFERIYIDLGFGAGSTYMAGLAHGVGSIWRV